MQYGPSALASSRSSTDDKSSASSDRSLTEKTNVYFAEHDPSLLEAYADHGEGVDRAGGYAIQGRGGALVQRIEGGQWRCLRLALSTANEDIARDRLQQCRGLSSICVSDIHERAVSGFVAKCISTSSALTLQSSVQTESCLTSEALLP